MRVLLVISLLLTSSEDNLANLHLQDYLAVIDLISLEDVFYVTQVKAAGLDGRSRDDGSTRRKNGNTRVDSLRETYGEDFAPDVRGDMHLSTLLQRARVDSLSQYLKEKK